MKILSEQSRDIAEKTIEQFKKNGLTFGELVRALLSSGPYTGGIASLWSAALTHRRFAWIEDAVSDLQNELTQMGHRFDPLRLSDAEMELIAEGMTRLAKSHRVAKRHRFVRIIAASMRDTQVSFDERLRFIKAVDEFEDVHLAILSVLRKQPDGQTMRFEEIAKAVFGDNFSDDQRDSLLLPALNVLSPSGFGFVGRQGEQTGKVLQGHLAPDRPAMWALYRLLALGRRFCEYLDDPAE